MMHSAAITENLTTTEISTKNTFDLTSPRRNVIIHTDIATIAQVSRTNAEEVISPESPTW